MKKIFFFAPLFLFCLCAKSQISEGGTPVSFQYEKILTKNIPVEVMPYVDVAALKKEDEINDQRKDIPWRFGYNIPVNFNLQNSGVWETVGKGDRIWRLKISSKNAVSINITFGEYFIPQGGKVFIYGLTPNPSPKERGERPLQILGAFTQKNNLPHRKLGVDVVKGDAIVIEYFEPHEVAGQGALLIERVTHGYRDYFSEIKNFGDAGSCNKNVVCPEGAPWQDQIRATGMNLSGGNAWCSGAMINNTCKDGTAYYLTANHCVQGENVTTWVFRFNYESDSCSPSTDGPYNFTVSGSTLRANNAASDFALLELSSPPPSNYNVFYAGWDRTRARPANQTVIHHPSGDVKKISFDYDSATATVWNGAAVWEIGNYEIGTTEPGSSGSPLFNQDQRIIGQLFGGPASCTDISSDNYGRFHNSWDSGGTSSNQLKNWLDMCNTGDTVIDGYDPNAVTLAYDAATQSVNGISTIYCGNNIDSVFPFSVIRNKGTDTLIKITVIYGLDGVDDTLVWSGSLATNNTDTVYFPAMFPSAGDHVFSVTVKEPNDSADQNIVNDSKSVSFKFVLNSRHAVFTLKTDDYGSETSWQVKDSTGSLWYLGGTYNNVSGGETIIDSLCLAPGCYQFIINDVFGDGMSGNNGNGTQGTYFFQNEFGDTLAKIDSVNFHFQETNNFCLPDTLTNVLQDAGYRMPDAISIFPNPNNGKFIIQMQDAELAPIFRGYKIQDAVIVIYNILGEKIYTSSVIRHPSSVIIDLSSYSPGLYFIKITGDAFSVTKKIIISDNQ